MNEWKELDKDNLPPDILYSDYEFEFMFLKSGWSKSEKSVHEILNRLDHSESLKYRYRLKVDERVGLFGKFWDVSDSIAFYGYLSEIELGSRYPYYCHDVDSFEHFEPGLPPERIDV
jgi:hypothetical protein